MSINDGELQKCWARLAFYFALCSVALANNLCSESASLSTGNAYHFQNCINVSFPSIPSADVSLVVEDSTVVALSLNTALLSLTNVTLRFIRCTILSDLSLSSGATADLFVNGLTVELSFCNITFDTAALSKQQFPAVFLSVVQPRGVVNLSIRMVNSSMRLISFPPPFAVQGNFGFMRVYQISNETAVSTMRNIRVTIEDSLVALLFGNIALSDGIVEAVDVEPALICFSTYRRAAQADLFVHSVSDVSVVVRGLVVTLQGSMALSLVTSEGTILDNASIYISNMVLQMASYGPYSNRSMQRIGVVVGTQKFAMQRVRGGDAQFGDALHFGGGVCHTEGKRNDAPNGDERHCSCFGTPGRCWS